MRAPTDCVLRAVLHSHDKWTTRYSSSALSHERGGSIDLSSQRLTSISALVIGALVKDNGSMTELNVSSNELAPDGIKTIIESLRVPTVLSLDLSANVPPTMSGTAKASAQAKQLAELWTSMVELSGLERLTFDRNELTELATVGNLLSLRHLSLSNNKLVSLPEDINNLRALWLPSEMQF